MDFASFKSQLHAARSFEKEIAGACFKLLLPTEYACRVAIESNLDGNGQVIGAKSSRQILDGALIGWEGVKASHLLPDAGEEPIAFSAAARAELLDCRLDIADRLIVEISVRLEERRNRMEAARKN